MSNMDIAQRHLERLDIVVKASEIRWGLMALEQLCTPETAVKFGKQWDLLSAAIMDSRHDDVCLLADGAIRGVWKMENEAIVAGKAPTALLSFSATQVPADDQNVCSVPPHHVPVHSKEWFRNGGDPVPF